MDKKYYQESEKRKYIRLDSVFPVEFQLVKSDSKEPLSPWQQGFTNNISSGGICLTVNNLSSQMLEQINNPALRFNLNINIPLSAKPISALARLVWLKQIKEELPNQYLIGLAYESISDKENRRIIAFVKMKRTLPLVTATVIIILAAIFLASFLYNLKLRLENQKLIDALVEISEKSSLAQDQIRQIHLDKEELVSRLAQEEAKIKSLEEKLAQAEGLAQELSQAKAKDFSKREETEAQINKLNSELEKLTKDKEILEAELSSLQSKEDVIGKSLFEIDEKKASLEEANIKKMYDWLKIHQNPRTGLISSYEGDAALGDWAFIYDQALSALSYTYFADYERAKKIFDFFKKAKRVKGAFTNAYYTLDGEVAEYTVHSGPNIWLGIAILHYTSKSHDKTYLKLAQELADWIIKLQNQDPQLGLRGGPDTTWFSTEHNLDAYAFFKMFYQETSNEKYALAAKNILAWLNKHAYDQPQIPVKRGKGDSTIATDTYAWSIAAIGPEELIKLGMYPDQIMEFAEKNCKVETTYIRKSGQEIRVRGFDFGLARHIPRGGVISCEWTAQMVMAYKIMADFYSGKDIAKQKFYTDKAQAYLTELGKLIISSPSRTGQGEGCLPYATKDFVDTGHGWMTPKGADTGSVAATVYALFAYYDFNPLQLKQ